jgi:hypothetical protein
MFTQSNPNLYIFPDFVGSMCTQSRFMKMTTPLKTMEMIPQIHISLPHITKLHLNQHSQFSRKTPSDFIHAIIFQLNALRFLTDIF